MKLESLDIALLVVMVGLALATVMTARVLKSAIGLAFTSAVVAILMYRLGAPLASVFELSVCAGLIPAIFIATVGMTRRLAGDELAERKRQVWRRFAALPALVILAGVALAVWHPAIPSRVPWVVDANIGEVQFPRFVEANAGEARLERVVDANFRDLDVREVLWNHRHADLLGQVTVLLAGAFAVVILVKELRHD
jgi:NADH:ubiquinone oxidoreductase subunit 6 (subunit J)